MYQSSADTRVRNRVLGLLVSESEVTEMSLSESLSNPVSELLSGLVSTDLYSVESTV